MSAPDDDETATFASLIRVLECGPIENKVAVFGLICRTAAAGADARRQQYIDDCWWLAEQLGLVTLVGTVTVQDVLSTAFNREAT
jgi:hypothetical protein